MLLLSYDITNTKLRSKFAKFLEKHGKRVQFSVFVLSNSPRVLGNVRAEIEKKYEKQFKDTDSVLIFDITETSERKIVRYGYEKHWAEPVIYY